jgi:hypothetical protein
MFHPTSALTGSHCRGKEEIEGNRYSHCIVGFALAMVRTLAM